MRLIVAGGRDFQDYSLLCKYLNHITSKTTEPIEVICGMARGADTLGENWAKSKGYPVKYFAADWDGLGKPAGHIRNKQMAEYATHCVAFWNGVIEKSGTYNMIQLAEKYKLVTRVVRVNY
jgi:YspA, cpYpsA-related SLOG family